jgi:hypothetical protein
VRSDAVKFPIYFFNPGAHNPISPITHLNQASVVNLPTADPSLGITERNVYRTLANSSTLRFLAHLYDNTTTTLLDGLNDSSLGSAPPSVGTLPANKVNVSGIPLGPATVLSRKLYRTAAGGATLKLLATIADNTTTSYADTLADSVLGANAPSSDASGLQQPSGSILPGAGSIIVAGTGAFRPGGGWAIIGNGQQTVRYAGITGGALTGIPAAGHGAITAAISYNSTISAAPMLLGLAPDAITWPIAKGTAINVLAQVDDTNAQQYLAQLVGGSEDGIQEAYVQDGRLSYTEAVARANAELALHNQVDVNITYTVRDPTTRVGSTITMALGPPTNLHGDFKIQSISRSAFHYPGVHHTCTVQASSSRFTLEDLLRLARAQQQLQGPV